MSERQVATTAGEVVRVGVWWAYVLAVVAVLVGWNPIEQVRDFIIRTVWTENQRLRDRDKVDAVRVGGPLGEVCNVVAHKPTTLQVNRLYDALGLVRPER